MHTILKAVICLTCRLPVVPPSKIPQHIHKHVPQFQVGDKLVDLLLKTFSLGESVSYPAIPIDPVFGITILEDPQYFCDGCNRGYQNTKNLQTHRERSQTCIKASHHMGYGQIIPGLHRRIIEVRLENLKPAKPIVYDYDGWIHQGITPERDYSKFTIAASENSSNLSAFFYNEGWLGHVQGHIPSELFEARRPHTGEDSYGDQYRAAAQRYLSDIQSSIQDNVVFGVLRDIGSVHEDKKFSFRCLRSSSISTYSLVLHRAIFSFVRFYVRSDWPTKYIYPLINTIQFHALKQLDLAFTEEKTLKEIDSLYHEACFLLFAHEKHQYSTSHRSTNLFSPVICFIILHCVGEKGNTAHSTTISNVVAPIMYSIRACIFRKVLELMKLKTIGAAM